VPAPAPAPAPAAPRATKADKEQKAIADIVSTLEDVFGPGVSYTVEPAAAPDGADDLDGYVPEDDYPFDA